MSCPNCPKGEKKAAVEPTAPTPLLYTPHADEVMGRDGISYRFNQAFIPAPRQPRGGWGVRFRIKGQDHDVSGSSARRVFRDTKSLFSLNGIRVSDRDLWFNLNIQWVGRAVPKFQKVTIEDLLALAQPGGEPETAPTGRRSVPPAEWGRKGWGMLQMYLALDTYNFGKFLGLAEELLSWVNPDVNPTTGCADCFIHFGKAVGQLRQQPRYRQEEAREWLVAVMNNVNSRKGAAILSYEKAAKINFWT